MTDFPASAAAAARSLDLQFASGGKGELPLRVRVAARRLQRLEEDVALRDRLMWGGYSGPEWDAFQRALIEYGYPVMLGWLRSGQLIAELGKKKVFGPRTLRDEAREPDHAHDIAVDVTFAAVKNFREKVLVPGVWRPEKGASLTTFFIGRCLLDFSNVYRSWKTRQDAARHLEIDAAVDVAEESAEQGLIRRNRAAVLLEHDTVALTIFSMVVEGYSHAEIGQRLGLTSKAVERRVAKVREKVRNRG